MAKYKDRIIEVFRKYLDQQNRVNINDYLLIFRDVAALDPQFQLFLNGLRFLDIPHNAKEIIETAKNYFFEFLGISQTVYPRITLLNIGYDFYWEFFDFFLRVNNGLFVEFGVGGETQNLFQLRKDLIDTINKYTGKLKAAKSTVEENIIKRSPGSR